MEQNEILLIHGRAYQRMTMELLERADLASEIGDRNARITLKPNLVLAATADSGAVTHPEIVAGVLEYLHSHGFRDIRVIEGSWVGARTGPAVKLSGIGAVCDKYQVPFIDLQKSSSHSVTAKGMELRICDEVANTDFLINLPVLKGHCQTLMTCALKNMKGLLPNTEKRRFHSMGLHKPIAYLSAAVKQNFILVDNICGDLDFEEGGNPVPMDRIFCCKDPVLCDAFGCQTMGLSLEDVPYIGIAERLGVGSTDVSTAKITALNSCSSAQMGRSSRRIQNLEGYVESKNACSACYGMLIHALDKMERLDELWGHQQKLCIGQGYRGEAGEIGIGSCTKDCDKFLSGCPPTAEEILRFLQDTWI